MKKNLIVPFFLKVSEINKRIKVTHAIFAYNNHFVVRYIFLPYKKVV